MALPGAECSTKILMHYIDNIIGTLEWSYGVKIPILISREEKKLELHVQRDLIYTGNRNYLILSLE